MSLNASLDPPKIPGPWGWPLIGNLVPFAADPLGYVASLHEAHGDLVQFQIADHTVVLVCHPDRIEDVLVGRWRAMHKDAIYGLLRPLLGDGLVTSEGEVWRRHRKLASSSFSARRVHGYGARMVALAEAYVRSIHRAGGERDVHHDMMELTQQIVLDTLFGTDLNVDTDIVGQAVETVMHGFVHEAHGLLRVVPNWVPTPGRRRSRQAIAQVDAVVSAVIEERRTRGPGDDLLSTLLAARDDQGQGFGDRQLRDEAVTLFMAGHETTAGALTFTLGLLGTHPEIRQRVQDEVDIVLGTRSAAAEDLAQLPLCDAVAREAMRLLPPVWAIGREAQQDVELGPHRVGAGTQLLISQWVTHRDPRWFADPEAFVPDRWLDAAWRQALPRMAYLPFGGGPRVCIGQHFAMLELVLVLATLVQHLSFTPVGAFPPALVPTITLRPKGPVRFEVSARRRSGQPEGG